MKTIIKYLVKAIEVALGVIFFIIFFIGLIIFLLISTSFFSKSNNISNGKYNDDSGYINEFIINNSVKVSKYDKNNNGKLVFLNKKLRVESNIGDHTFGVKSETALLVRLVETYQWIEKRKDVSYRKVWTDKKIHSRRFIEAEKHKNPVSVKYKNRIFFNDNVYMNDFKLSDSQFRSLFKFKRDVFYKKVNISKTSGLSNKSKINFVINQGENIDLTGFISKSIIDKKYIYIGENYELPKIGDQRISFYSYLPREVSILAQQDGRSFSPYPVEKSSIKINYIKPGLHTINSLTGIE